METLALLVCVRHETQLHIFLTIIDVLCKYSEHFIELAQTKGNIIEPNFSLLVPEL